MPAEAAFVHLSTAASLAGDEPVEERRRQVSLEELRSTSSASCAPNLQILPNALFLHELRQERSRSNRSQAPLSMIVLQLATTAESNGEILKVILRSLRRGLRDADSVGFWQQNSLALLLPDTDNSAAIAVAGRVSSGIGELIKTVSVASYPDVLFEKLDASVSNKVCGESELLRDAPALKPVQAVLKRGLDIFGAATGLVLLSPLLLGVMVAIKLGSPGPAIFRQIRLGKDFRPFTFYKFRSMYTDADDQVHRTYLASLISGKADAGDQGGNGEKFYKIKADARVTPIGRFIRKASIDELPQLVNVLRGEMSLVGPRPPIPYETENYQAWHLRRIFVVKPGLTGLWQVEGRSRTTFDEMVRMDIRYSCDWSFLLDLKLLLRTVRVVLEGRGAV